MASDARRGPQGPRVVARPVAAGGWRRAVTGVLVGLSAGALLGAALPRDDQRAGGTRRTADRSGVSSR